MNILSELLNYYGELVTDSNKIYNLGEVFNYYYADDMNVRVHTKNLIKVDISSAYPTICELIFGSNSPFILQLKSIETKLERNIFISNTLKNITTSNYLLELNNYCKIVVMSYIFNYYDNIFVFEYQKDGVLFSGEKTFSKNKEFDLLINKHFKFHIDSISSYIRFNKTSIIQERDRLYIKGNYKEPPIFITSILSKLLNDENVDLSIILTIYNESYFNYIKTLGMNDLIKNYYKFNDKYFLDAYGNKTTKITECSPFSVLRYFLYPILAILKS